ncbi:MAG TPA: hypothetical protein VGB77_07690 [Abditibacteriaceae bacterium]
MAVSVMQVWERAVPTQSAMAQLESAWVWPEMTPAAFQALITALQVQRDTVADMDAAQEEKRGLLDTQLRQLDLLTTQGKAAGKFHFRSSPDKLGVIEALEEIGTGRSSTLEEARAFESAWEKVGPSWVFSMDLQLADYQELRAQCESLMDDYSDAKTAWRAASGKMTTLAAQLSEHCVAWYDAAARVFPEGTAEGNMIRGTIPTYTAPPATLEPTP